MEVVSCSANSELIEACLLLFAIGVGEREFAFEKGGIDLEPNSEFCDCTTFGSGTRTGNGSATGWVGEPLGPVALPSLGVKKKSEKFKIGLGIGSSVLRHMSCIAAEPGVVLLLGWGWVQVWVGDLLVSVLSPSLEVGKG